MDEAVIRVEGLDFQYSDNTAMVLKGLDLQVEEGSRCLLVGANGVGKTTLLGVLAGRYLIDRSTVRILGRAAFHDTSLAHEVAFLEGRFPFTEDVEVGAILAHTPGLERDRVEELIKRLDVDIRWRMHIVSEGQRRRVQLLLKLAQRNRVLLLDEVMTDLDVVARSELLSFLREEAEAEGVTILYATHIFDGLNDWATHICLMDQGGIALMKRLDELEELGVGSSPLNEVVEGWIRAAGASN